MMAGHFTAAVLKGVVLLGAETAITVQGTARVIESLENGTVYYVWIRALNNAGKGGFSPRVRGTPGV
jgi:hypothetical protein